LFSRWEEPRLAGAAGLKPSRLEHLGLAVKPRQFALDFGVSFPAAD
jgi:hypothetical protein